jgi:hypothetical protein
MSTDKQSDLLPLVSMLARFWWIGPRPCQTSEQTDCSKDGDDEHCGDMSGFQLAFYLLYSLIIARIQEQGAIVEAWN